MAEQRVREPKDPRDLVLGEVIGMLRKSSDGEKAGKSLDGQEGAVLETCQDYNLPIDTEHIWREAAGMSGSLWWAGGGATGIAGDEAAKKTRPVLTKIVNGIVEGSIRCLVVWSLDRLARHVGIMESLMEIMNKYGCLLYDRRGPVDIFGVEGRDRVRSNMTSAQYARERAAVDAPRGVDHNKKKGKIVISANRLGFRAVGKASGEIIHKLDEQDLAYEIFHLLVLGTPENPTYHLGEPGHGPYSVIDLAEMLTHRQDVPWLDGVYRRLVNYEGKRVVHPATLYNILADPIYQGRQRHRKVESPCPCFLKPDGEPVIPTWLFEAAQTKLENGRQAPGVKKNSYALSHLIRCGVCGGVLIANVSGGLTEDGIYRKVQAWVPKSRKGTAHRCPHKIPLLPMSIVNEYVLNSLAPHLLAELNMRNDAGDQRILASERATLQRRLDDAKRRLNVDLPRKLAEDIGKEGKEDIFDIISSAKAVLKREIEDYETRLRTVEGKLVNIHKYVPGIQALRDLSETARRDVLREVLRWAAVVPSGPISNRFRSPDGTRLAKQKVPAPQYPTDEGRLVFLTTWGTMHTAFIYKEMTEHSHMPVHRLRPAEPGELVATVNDLPDPWGFVNGIEQSYLGVRRPFCADDVAPGLLPHDAAPVAVFEVDENELL